MVNSGKSNNLKVLHHNIESLNNKILELSLFIHDSDIMIDVLCFTEHWISVDQISMINLDQYSLRSKFCRTTKKGGGSCIFVRDSLQTNKSDI
jgi:hypothetical protein